jgi:cobyrinic acid a,c-diamide synthase
MLITSELVAEQLIAYLHRRIALSDLVDWAEMAMMDGEFSGADWATSRDIVARLGVADVRAFDLSWQECETMLEQLGFRVHLQIIPA